METLFGGEDKVEFEVEDMTMGQVIRHIKNNYLREREELFIQTDANDTSDKDYDTVRAGIIVMINDTDWELLDTIDYKVQDGDNISFISTLHGG
uniref:Ubiquitin-related modifier 1 homolog n=1 Tax=Euplotes harpa TaxID=151035 RepID=A0A7S3JGS3_9SPIT